MGGGEPVEAADDLEWARGGEIFHYKAESVEAARWFRRERWTAREVHEQAMGQTVGHGADSDRLG